jgi:hypothetical protein
MEKIQIHDCRTYYQFFRLKGPNFFDGDPDSGSYQPWIRDGKNRIRDVYPGSLTLLFPSPLPLFFFQRPLFGNPFPDVACAPCFSLNIISNVSRVYRLRRRTSIKSDGFQLCCVILKKHSKNSGFIPATLYMWSFLFFHFHFHYSFFSVPS